MRRRRHDNAPRTAEELAELYARVKADALDLEEHARNAYIRDVLALHGTDPLEALRARVWLRRGRVGPDWRV